MGPCSISTISLWSINGTWPESVLASIISSGSRRFWCFSHLSMAPLIMCEELPYWVMGSGLLPENAPPVGSFVVGAQNPSLLVPRNSVTWPVSQRALRQAVSTYSTSRKNISPRRNEMQFFNHSSQKCQSEIFYLIQSWKGGRLHAAPLLDWLTQKIFF